jgi:hypothetical protein
MAYLGPFRMVGRPGSGGGVILACPPGGDKAWGIVLPFCLMGEGLAYKEAGNIGEAQLSERGVYESFSLVIPG